MQGYAPLEASLQTGGGYMANPGSSKRRRATAVVIKDGKILLVKDKGKHLFSLPGGQIERGEPAIGAAVRELWEELRIIATKVERVREADCVGSLNEHHVCLVEVTPEPAPRPRKGELDSFLWWDRKDPAPPLRKYVPVILNKLDQIGKLNICPTFH